MRRAVWLLGVCQCVFWGVLYYAFSVLLVPIEIELHLSRSWVAGAFSLGLLTMALVAPGVGRALDRGQGPLLTRLGALSAVAGLLLASQATTAIALYAAWLLLGMAMAVLLYEPAFALVIRAVTEHGHRLRALAAVTVMGGLASTIFLPLIAAVVDRWGWRTAELGCAVAVLLATWAMERFVLPALPAAGNEVKLSSLVRGGRRTARFASLAVVFVSGTLASMAMTTLLIPLLLTRGASTTAAATVLAMLGVMQLPGRIWLLREGKQPSLPALASMPLLLQACGLIAIAIAPALWIAVIGVAIFGLGAGLQTLARPWLVQQIYGVSDAGHWNGRLARVQGLARAAGPIATAGIAAWSGTGTVLLGLDVVLFAVVPLARRSARTGDHCRYS